MTLTPREIEDRFEEAAFTLRRLPGPLEQRAVEVATRIILVRRAVLIAG